MKIALIFLTFFALSTRGFCESPKKPVGSAAKEGKVSATVVAWSVLGVGLLITIGVITAIAIQNEKLR